MPTQPAVLGAARLNNFRLAYEPAALAARRRTTVRIVLDEVDVRVRVVGLSIHDLLNEAPNSCTLTFSGVPPPSGGAAPLAPDVGQDLRVTLNSDAPLLLFAGTLQTTSEVYEGSKPVNKAYPCSAIDYTTRLNYLRPFGNFVNVSASTIAQSLVTTFAPAFTTYRIEAGLKAVTITFDGSADFIACLGQLAALIGGYTKVESMDVYLFLADTTAPPDPVDASHRPLDDPPITVKVDDSQLVTRVFGKGHAEALLVDVAAGETILPIVDTVMFEPGGGLALAGTTPDGSASQRLQYAAADRGGAGTLIGPPLAPSAAPTVHVLTGAGLGIGTYRYAYRFMTATGGTILSPVSVPAVTSAGWTGPGNSIGIANSTDLYDTSNELNGWDVGDTVEMFYSYGDATGPNNSAGPSTSVSVAAVVNPWGTWYNTPSHPAPMAIKLTMRYSADPTVTNIFVWYRINGGTWRTLGAGGQYANHSEYGAILFTMRFGSPSLSNPVAGLYPTNPAHASVVISDVALGPTAPVATTAREVYRTAVNGSVYKWLTTFSNNTSTGPYTDTTPDSGLGGVAPTTDTAAFPTGVGQVLAGSVEIPTASAAPFLATGGWTMAPSGDLIRYTGISGNKLTGIPASGPGAILTTMVYGAPLVAAPVLRGVTGLTVALLKGSQVHIFVQVDDGAAQAEAAARESTPTYTSAGIHEHLISDDRRAAPSLVTLCAAHLALHSRPIVTFNYATRDVKTKSGKTVHINMAGYPVGDYVIQDVGIDEVDVAPATPPRFTVTASSVLFSLPDILRRLITGQQESGN